MVTIRRIDEAQDIGGDRWEGMSLEQRVLLPPHVVDAARTARYEYRQPATSGYFVFKTERRPKPGGEGAV